ncbi:MAG: elongation factor G, partial [Lentisphaeria bacterium]|nr:elongation factor G [Lentisphaeria bacterium]
KYNVPIVALINTMDRTGADFDGAVREIKTKLGATPVPVMLPIGSEASFEGVIDVLGNKALYFSDADKGVTIIEKELDDEQRERREAAFKHLVECLAEVDDEVMEVFLNDEVPPVEELRKAMRRATIKARVVPVAAASAFKNKGIQPLLDVVTDYLPSPLDIWDIKGTNPDTGEAITRHVGDLQPFSALVFKIMSDPFVGKLYYFRVYSGVATQGMTMLNPRTGKRERMGRLLQMHANNRVEQEEIFSGDIAAAVGLKNVTTGDTLCLESDPIVLESMFFPEPVISIAVEPKTSGDRDKLNKGLLALSEEDPTFQVRSDEETGQTIISGMGELHLEIILDRLVREFKVEANTGAPQVAYREAISKIGHADCKFVRQTGGHGQYGHCIIDITPLERGAGIVIENKVVGGNIPKEFIKPIENGIREAAAGGVLAGYPVIDFKVDIIDGSYHPVDSSEMAFKIAGSMAFKEAMKKADPVLLEPIMKVSVVVPEEYAGTVFGDFNARRGTVTGQEIDNGTARIFANVPLSNMFGYATDLRSKTQGRGNYVMEPSHHAEVPKNVGEEIMSERNKKG